MEKMLRMAIPALAVAWFGAGCPHQPMSACPADGGHASLPDASRSDAGVPSDDAAAVPDDAGSADAGAPDAARDAGPPPRCIGSYVEVISLFSARAPIVLAAHGAPNAAEIYAWPWRMSLGEARPVAADVTWHAEGDAVLRTELIPDPRGRQLRVTAEGDLFDMGTRVRDASLLIRACVTNLCPREALEGRCRCDPEVCSGSIIAYAVPALDGLWEFTEDGAPSGPFAVVQDGRDLLGTPWAFPLYIGGSGLEGGELGMRVTGVIATDRRTLSGIVELEDGEIVGSWSARRVDP